MLLNRFRAHLCAVAARVSKVAVANRRRSAEAASAIASTAANATAAPAAAAEAVVGGAPPAGQMRRSR